MGGARSPRQRPVRQLWAQGMQRLALLANGHTSRPSSADTACETTTWNADVTRCLTSCLVPGRARTALGTHVLP